MLQLFRQVLKLLSGIRYGFRSDPTFRAIFYLMLYLLFGATIFYWRVEGWSLVDSFYFCVMTMSTIGYGDFSPTTTLSKLFTVVFALVGIGVFVSVAGKLVEIVLINSKFLGKNGSRKKKGSGQSGK